MLKCLSFRSLRSPASAPVLTLPPPPSQGNSTEDTSVTSTRSSPGPNVSREYNLAVQANSYNEIRSIIQVSDPSRIDLPQDQVQTSDGYAEENSYRQLLSQVLHPDRECVQEALELAKPSTLTRLVSTYFEHSETASELCLLLHRSVHRARAMYAPLLDFLGVLPADSNFTQSQCDYAFDVFLKFDTQDNPFPSSSDSQNFSNMRSHFSELRRQLDRRVQKSRSRIRLFCRATTGSALSFIVTAVGVVVFAVVAFAAGPVCTAYIPHPKTIEKKELARLAQLDAAARGTFTLDNDLATIDRLVARLYTEVEGDKLLIRLGLERGRDRHLIQEVLKQLRKNDGIFLRHLNDLEEHIYLCFNAVNKARSSLFQEICLHQTS